MRITVMPSLVTRAMILAAAAALILLVWSTAAQAAPGTVTGTNLSLTVSDTTPAPGETITVSMSHVHVATETSAPTARFFFGSQVLGGANAMNLADLALVPGSCATQFSNCSFTAADTSLAFRADVPVGNVGDTITGSAQFTVSASATDGETIAFSGQHVVNSSFGSVFTGETSPIALTVTAPPAADLGVSLGATAGPFLSGSINYDAAVTNHGPAAATSATITTQLSSHASSIASSTCTFSSSTHQVSCPIGALANGATTHATFAAYYGALTLGLPLNATATRTASSPADNNAANDSDTAGCTVLTGLIIVC